MLFMDFCINEVWTKELDYLFNSVKFKDIMSRLDIEYRNKVIFPPKECIFNAFNLCNYNDLSVVIIGQDPYINPGEANGLAFSVNKGIKIPPSLRNIYTEIENNFNKKFTVKDGDLSYLAKQGVLLLNSILTVECGISGSHKKIGWEFFTDGVILHLSKKKRNIVYMLWGDFAKSKRGLIDPTNNLILTSAHPSPFSASGFFNNWHFLTANKYLTSHGKMVIKWVL